MKHDIPLFEEGHFGTHPAVIVKHGMTNATVIYYINDLYKKMDLSIAEKISKDGKNYYLHKISLPFYKASKLNRALNYWRRLGVLEVYYLDQEWVLSYFNTDHSDL